MDYKRILIVQTAFPGDVILTTPLIRAVKENFPAVFLFALVIPETQELLKNNPHLAEVITYDKRKGGWAAFTATVRKLKAREFDLALVPHRSFRSALLAFLTCKRRVGFENSAGGFLFTELVAYRQNWHEIERNLSLLNFAGGEAKIILPELFPGPEQCKKVEGILRQNNFSFSDELVCIAPGSVWVTKRWLPEGFAQVADWLIKKEQVRVIMIGSREDSDLAEEITTRMSEKPINACGELSLLESAALISGCRLVLSNDSAPTHMAVAMRTPAVTIFGSTGPEFGFYPYGEGNAVIQKELYCRPCGIHGRRRCPEGHFRCMKEITAEEVYDTVRKRLHEKRVQTS